MLKSQDFLFRCEWLLDSVYKEVIYPYKLRIPSKKKSYKAENPVTRKILSVPRVSVLEEFHCIYIITHGVT